MSGPLILDLGYGNVRSVALAFERLGASPTLSSDPAAVEQAEHVILPGVGAAGAAMARLRDHGLVEVVRGRTRPTLGICLGMQLMFEQSDEAGGTALLGVIGGTVTALQPAPRFPVPHMGWSKITTTTPDIGLTSGEHVYFAHGFACPDGPATIASATYGERQVPAAIRYRSWWGAQFHPERSSAAGSRFLAAFLQS